MKNILEKKEKVKDIIDYELFKFVFETLVEIHDEIFEISRGFPADKLVLVKQLRNYSKLVCTEIAEAWKCRTNKSEFIKKLSDSAHAASRTQICLEYASKYNIIDVTVFKRLDSKYEDMFELLCLGIKED